MSEFTLIQKLVGCRKRRIWSGTWDDFDLEKPFDALRWRACTRLEWLRDMPSRWAWHLADWLCWLACKLRGHRTYEGWYGIQCNEAERLSQNIQFHLITSSGDGGEPLPITLGPDDHESMRQDVNRLAALARATFWHE